MPRTGNKKKRSPAPAATSKNLTAKKKPSPDSVVCIDLTTSSTMDDYLIRPETEKRLGSVRKELEPPSAKKKKKRAGLKTTGLENTDWDEVIVIDSDEEEEEDTPMTDADTDCSIIVMDNAAAAVASRPTKKAKVKNEMDSSLSSRKKKFDNEDNDKMENEDVEVVEATAPKLAAATMVAESSKTTTSGDDDDVVVEGVVNETRLPHMRQHCTRYPFNFVSPSVSSYAFKRISTLNKQSCELCYCYVCDCPVKDCEHWHSHKTSKAESNHCSASEKYGTWDKMRSREKKKRERANTTTTAATAATTVTGSADGENERTDDDPPAGYHFRKDCPSITYGYAACKECWCYICDKDAQFCNNKYGHKFACPTDESARTERQRRKLSTYGLPGPFEPDNRDACKDPTLTKCRHCSWYSRLHCYRPCPSSDDWCTVCGRVASEKDFGKRQRNSNDSKTDQNDESFFVGQKDIPFRIHAHDPRLFEEYKGNWGGNGSEWGYDDAEREEEVFLHRLGKLPLISLVYHLIPKVAKENIPKTSEVPEAHSFYHDKSSLRDATDAVIIEDPEQLQFVTLIVSIARKEKDFIEIDASWNKESRSGLFKIRFKIPKNSFLGPNNRDREHLPILVGLWFGIFPLQPSEICGLLEATSFEGIIEGVEDEFLNQEVEIHVKPFALECNDAVNRLREKLPSRVDSISSAKSVNESRLTLAPSNGCKFSGGVCAPASLDPLHDSIARYYSQKFMSLMRGQWRTNDLVASCVGATRGNTFKIADAILGFETSVAAEFCLFHHAEDWRYQLSNPSIKDIMTRAENLGHEPEDCVEGLKIELLDFQRQSLKWALEREQTPGGVQSFFWPKLPAREGQEDLYFSPMLKLFRKDKPALVRGGFIAEEMGLGKTVISLALILKNPAPELPLSGSPISELKKENPSSGTSKTCGWEKNLYEKTSIRNKKTGSVISRGTLVICPVSLVGQWIDEARSKLEEPGLVYPYHGSGRKRVPKILAENSIVVTTYDVVSSDAFYYKKKAGFSADYCPPLQQVRWWRIICDEGHILRQANTGRSQAVSSLVADHKWIVTGTPMNTSHFDLKNQLRFLGFDNVDRLFSELSWSSSRGKAEVNVENLLYFLRPIMMRHSQEQKYKGTSTTLMSLPPKTERKELICFSSEEKKEFQKLENEAQDWYINFRSANLSKISSHFLKISSKLTPLRIACSGGKYPINSQNINNDDAAIEDDGEQKKPAVSVYSKFEFKSKFNALLQQLKKIRDEEPDSKSLVFSQFSSTLDWLKVELPKHGFQFRTLSGDMTMTKRAKALSEFQNDPPTTIFLLSMRAGAVGINLTQANRVFLMEPSFNPALEAQAIGRVHRLGQKRPVEIVRFIVKNSFEERMVNFLEEKYGGHSGEKSKDTPGNGKKKDSSAESKDDGIQCIDIAGNLKTDKAELVAAEFDTLFGVKDRLLADESAKDDVKAGSI